MTTTQVHTMISSDVHWKLESAACFPSFQKRGWVEIKTEKGRHFYLVKNRMLKVPDKSLPKVTTQEVEQFRDLEPDERDLLLYALGIFKGKLT